MRYISTRGTAPALAFDDVLLAGLARDGGLYVPAHWPQFSPAEWRALRDKPYAEIAYAVMRPFVGGTVADADLLRLCAETYTQGIFGHPAIAPLKQLGPGLWSLELFHGPTLAFKDFALQLVGRLFDHVLTKRGTRVTVIGATSGDTGSAAIAACLGRSAVDVVMFHPHGRVSDVQRRQMTTVLAPNIHNVALDGTFDDCQDAVKAMFNDLPFRDAHNLSAVNSINWARVAAQIAYYAHAALSLGAPDRKVSFCVPTGNFGNILAAYAARRMGLPIDRLVVATNRNDIMARTVLSGRMALEAVAPTVSPSMDVQVSSNFERMVFELAGRDGGLTATMMSDFRKSGGLDFPANMHASLAREFEAGVCDEEATLAEIGTTYRTTGELVDTHTAVALHVARKALRDGSPMVVASTAHPAKFPDAVEKASGVRPALPPHLAGLMTRPERVTRLPNDMAKVKEFVSAATRHA
ncbi:MAG: threonine synthase [Proteobacteria bacterium]|nr:threonine synthase [Pseudomonadota bacterium]